MGQDNLLVIGQRGVSEENLSYLHPVAHVEADEKVIENEELEVGFVQVDE